MTTVPTGAGQVQEHETGSDPGEAVDNLGVMTVQALVETFPWVDIDAQWFLFTFTGCWPSGRYLNDRPTPYAQSNIAEGQVRSCRASHRLAINKSPYETCW